MRWVHEIFKKRIEFTAVQIGAEADNSLEIAFGNLYIRNAM